MGRSSRQKGAGGEREVRDLLRQAGFQARRDGRLDDDLVHDIQGYHLEVKRRERYELDAWIEQAEKDAGARKPVIVFRKSRHPWRAIVHLSDLLALLRLEVTTNQKEPVDAILQEGDQPPPIRQHTLHSV